MNRADQDLMEFLEETFQGEKGDAAASIGVLPVIDINIHPVENNCFQEADEKWNAYHEKLDNSNGRNITSNASNVHDPEIEIAFQNAEKAEQEAQTKLYKKVLNYCEISIQTQGVPSIHEYLTDLYGEAQKKVQEAQYIALDRMRKPTMNAVKVERYRAIAKTYNDVFRAMSIGDADK